VTTLAEAREAVYQRFVDQWGSTTPYCFENEATTLDQGRVPWARVSFRLIGGGQAGLGSNRYDRNCLVIVQIFTPVNQGTAEADLLAKTAADIFESQSFDGLDFFDAVVQLVPIRAGEKWNQNNVSHEGFFQEVK